MTFMTKKDMRTCAFPMENSIGAISIKISEDQIEGKIKPKCCVYDVFPVVLR